MRSGSRAFDGPYDFCSRMAEGEATNPEELLGAAHTGCFSMALALQPTDAGVTVKSIYTTAKSISKSVTEWPIQRIDPDTEASISDMAAEAFDEHAQDAKNNCPVSRACPASIFICEPSSCKFQRVDRCPYIFVWRASPMVNTE
jgi:lipoyl-dependent peroxiredoxin